MNALKKIAYNCRQATFLIEKKQLTRLTVREKIELKIHLAGCSVCKTFEHQSVVINQWMKRLLREHTSRHWKLNDGYKKQLQKKISEKMNNR